MWPVASESASDMKSYQITVGGTLLWVQAIVNTILYSATPKVNVFESTFHFGLQLHSPKYSTQLCMRYESQLVISQV